ncbi:MAG: cyclodeaminase/cyclohydrolase family protein, partial [Streptosporangiaceae bacterium]
RGDALTLADADAEAFGAVAAAYALPRGSEEEKQARSAAIAAGLAGAARPPADVIRTALSLTGLAEDLLPAGNRNVITDVGAAAVAVRAAVITSQLNIEVNLRGIKDGAVREELTATAAMADQIAERADRIVTAIREELRR